MMGSSVVAPDESYPLTGASMTPFLGYRKTLPIISQPNDPAIRHIPLTRGLVAVVDPQDFEWLSQWRWTARNKRSGIYAVRNPHRNSGETSGVSMHRAILGLSKADGMQVDHVNHDPLDNRRSNLRICTAQENARNQRVRATKSNEFKGTYLHKASGLWHACITISGKTVSLGYYRSPQEGHAAYCNAAAEHFGEFACNK